MLQKELISHKAKKGYLIRNIRTQFLQKELGNLINNQTVAEKRMTTQKTRFFPLQMTSKDTRLHILEDPTKLGTTIGKVAKRNPKITRL